MMTVQTFDVALYAPVGDSHGLRDAWAPPVPVETFGWAPAGTLAGAQPVEANRRPTTTDREIYPREVAGGPRARWSFPDGVFEQIGHAANYANGPWWSGGSAVVVYVRRVEG